MTKEDIVAEVAVNSRQPKLKISAVLDQFLAEVSDALARQVHVEIRRFGAFEVITRQSRTARDLNTNQEIRVAVRVLPRFVPFAAFKERVARQGVQTTSVATTSPVLEALPPSANTLVEHPLTIVGEGVSSTGIPPDSEPLEALAQRVGETPDDHEARVRLIAAYIADNQLAEALKQCEAILRVDAIHKEALNQIGDIFERMGLTDRAIEAYDRLLRIAPNHIAALMRRGVLRGQTGRLPDAETDLRRVLEIDPANAMASLQLGLVYTKRGLYQRATQEFEQARQSDPNSVEACFNLGKSYDHLERFDEAVQQFEELVALQPEHPRAYWYLGVLYDKKKMSGKALAMYQQSNRLSTTKKESERT